MKELIPQEVIENKIFIIRNRKVMIDADLAKLYEVSTKRLNEQVKRNRDRFPDDFIFQLSKEEKTELVANCDRFNSLKHASQPPFAFTEQGVAMLSSVLKSKRAIHVNIQIMRTFTKLRQMLLTHDELRQKIEEMEKKYDKQFQVVFNVIKQLLEAPPKKEEPPEKPKRKIGFHQH